MAIPVAVRGFLKTLLRSELLGREQLSREIRQVPRPIRRDPEALADYFVKRGLLSRYQAQKLLHGTALGLVLGPYQILAPIGRGGMGTVYLARDSRNQQLVAIKVLPPKRAREEERVRVRFRREMEMCQRVAHPHLAYTYEVGVLQGVYYIAMEYIPGKSIYRLVNEQGPFPVPRAAHVFAEVAAGLEYAHRQGLIHRDLKPSNILVTPHDHAKVLDLGLALMQGEPITDRKVTGGQGYVVGTMDYIAPEQTEDAANVDPRSDLYALGCTLYFALTGRAPFPGGTSLEKIQRHRSEEPIPVAQLNPSVPVAFSQLVSRLLAKNPDARPTSAAAVREALLSWTTPEADQPLDRSDDTAYQEAVSELEQTDVPPGLSTDTLSIEPLAKPQWHVSRLSALLRSSPQPLAVRTRSWPLPILVFALWAMLLGGLVLYGLLKYLVHR